MPPDGADISDLQPLTTKAAARMIVRGLIQAVTVAAWCLCVIFNSSLFPRGMVASDLFSTVALNHHR